MGDRDHILITQRALNRPGLATASNRSGGEFYITVPLENLLLLFSAIPRGMFRYVVLWGPVLWPMRLRGTEKWRKTTQKSYAEVRNRNPT
jgi:hypothetical protein